jgi:hypothetical protein
VEVNGSIIVIGRLYRQRRFLLFASRRHAALLFLSRGIDLQEMPLEELLWRHTNPTVRFTPPPGQPLALWFYSRTQHLLAVFCYEMVDADSMKNPPAIPDLRVIEKFDPLGAKSVYGTIPEGWCVAVHAYLLPFHDLQLEKLSRRSQEVPGLTLFNFALPLLFPSTSTCFVIAPDASGKQTIARLRFDAATPFLTTRWSARLLALPVALIWLLLIVLRLRKTANAVCMGGRGLSPANRTARPCSFGILWLSVPARQATKSARLDHSRTKVRGRPAAVTGARCACRASGAPRG